jgi:hypothetical protein
MRKCAVVHSLIFTLISCTAVWAQVVHSNPPFESTPCNMNCLDKGNIVAAPKSNDPALDRGRHRLIVLTDQGADNDDSQSMVRLVLYSNDIDIEGLVATTSTFMMDHTNPWLIERTIKAYAQVQPNLLKHDSHYPSAEYLKSLIKSGSPEYGLGGVGPGKDSDGSELIIAALKKKDLRPLWVTVWGGPNTLAQALWKIRATEKPEAAQKLIAKLRVYSIGDQDNSGYWIRQEFPALFWIAPTGFGSFRAAPIPDMHSEMTSPEWIAKNIQQGHGPLGEVYPDIAYGMEGDTSSFLNLIPNGMNDPSHPNHGGWGGRFELYTPKPLHMSLPGVRAGRSQNMVVPEPETRPFWASAEDQYTGPMAQKANWLREPDKDRAALPKDAGVPRWRWREDVQNDFAARMEWSTKPCNEANHPPVAVLAEDTPDEFTVHSGQEFHLNATGSYDPDHDSISFYWFQYVEAGDLPEPVSVNPFSQALADLPVVAPEVDSPKTIHFICRVTDKGTPPLSRYRRVIIHVVP